MDFADSILDVDSSEIYEHASEKVLPFAYYLKGSTFKDRGHKVKPLRQQLMDSAKVNI